MVNARSGGPLKIHSDFTFALLREDALHAASHCTFLSNGHLRLCDSGIFIHATAGYVGRESRRRFTHTGQWFQQRLLAKADADVETTQGQTTSSESQCKCSAPHIYLSDECPGKMSWWLTGTFPFKFEYKSNQFEIPCSCQFPLSHSFHHSVSINAQQTTNDNSTS